MPVGEEKVPGIVTPKKEGSVSRSHSNDAPSPIPLGQAMAASGSKDPTAGPLGLNLDVSAKTQPGELMLPISGANT